MKAVEAQLQIRKSNNFLLLFFLYKIIFHSIRM